MAGLGGADEGDFLELIIANERVLQWIELLELPGNPKRLGTAMSMSSGA